MPWDPGDCGRVERESSRPQSPQSPGLSLSLGALLGVLLRGPHKRVKRGEYGTGDSDNNTDIPQAPRLRINVRAGTRVK